MDDKLVRFTSGNDLIRPIKGTLLRDQYFGIIHEQLTDYHDLKLPPEVVERIKRIMAHQVWGAQSHSYIICKGKDCFFADFCEFAKLDNCPKGKYCLDEVMYTIEIEKRLIEGLDVDPEDVASMSAVGDIIALRMLMRRVFRKINKDHPDLTVDIIRVSGINSTTEEAEHPLLARYLQMQTHCRQLFEDLLATRRIKATLGDPIKNTENTRKLQEVMEKLDRIISPSSVVIENEG